MMPNVTFSAKTKVELCKYPIEKGECALAEFCGMVLFSHTLSGSELKITTENQNVAARASKLIRSLFGYDFDRKIIPAAAVKKYSMTIEDKDKLAAILDALGIEPKKALSLRLNGALVEEDDTRAGFVRGAFLTSGTVLDPESEYHLELVTSHFTLSREVVALLLELELNAKLAIRKSNHIIYFKESGHIEDLLTRIGAPVSAMAVMEAKMYKELRNKVNRKVNCETANLSKTADAAGMQLIAIHKIADRLGLDALSPGLRQAAELRLNYPEATLSELSDNLNGQVSKSGLNHRYRKLLKLAEEYSKK